MLKLFLCFQYRSLQALSQEIESENFPLLVLAKDGTLKAKESEFL